MGFCNWGAIKRAAMFTMFPTPQDSPVRVHARRTPVRPAGCRGAGPPGAVVIASGPAPVIDGAETAHI